MFFYLASPYSHPDKEIREQRYVQTLEVTAKLMLLKSPYTIFSPIVHCHVMAEHCALPTNHTFWWKHNMAMLKKAKGLLVLTLPGWQESVGLKAELEFTESLGKPVRFITYDNHVAAFDMVK